MRTMLIATLFALAPAVSFAGTDDGKRIYESNCMACHGQKGDGKGPAAAALKPRPVDFTQADWWKGRTDAAVKASIRAGRPGTAMMPFGRLTDSELDDLIAYLRSLEA